MAGLKLLQDYSSDSEDDTNKLNHEETAALNVTNNKKNLPLPQSILSLKGVTHHEEIIDNPLEHGGRIRSFKHERGNWATLVYIDYVPTDEMLKWMKTVNLQLAERGNLFENFHVSLTRTLILKYHWIDSFVEAVKNVANRHEAFIMTLNNIKIYCNENKTRTFMGLTLETENNNLKKLTNDLDKIMEDYQLPTFYEDASHHVSFAWCLGDQRKTLKTLLSNLIPSFHDYLSEHSEQGQVYINKIQLKIGNKLYNFILK